MSIKGLSLTWHLWRQSCFQVAPWTGEPTSRTKEIWVRMIMRAYLFHLKWLFNKYEAFEKLSQPKVVVWGIQHLFQLVCISSWLSLIVLLYFLALLAFLVRMELWCTEAWTTPSFLVSHIVRRVISWYIAEKIRCLWLGPKRATSRQGSTLVLCLLFGAKLLLLKWFNHS